jgi:hypothetical protein
MCDGGHLTFLAGHHFLINDSASFPAERNDRIEPSVLYWENVLYYGFQVAPRPSCSGSEHKLQCFSTQAPIGARPPLLRSDGLFQQDLITAAAMYWS